MLLPLSPEQSLFPLSHPMEYNHEMGFSCIVHFFHHATSWAFYPITHFAIYTSLILGIIFSMLLETSLHDFKNQSIPSSRDFSKCYICVLREWSQITKLSLIRPDSPASLVKHLPNPILHHSPGSCWLMPGGLATSLEHSLFLPLPGTAYCCMNYTATYRSYWSNDQEGRQRQIPRENLLFGRTETSGHTNRKGKATSVA